LTGRIIGAFYEVYNELGQGFLASVYEKALAVALAMGGLRVGRQVPIPVWFRGHQVGDFRADLLVEDVVILELKADRVLEPVHEAQLLNYLRATAIEVGLLLNFGPQPQVKRLVFDNSRKGPQRNTAADERR
jgi:GxxExxY protein